RTGIGRIGEGRAGKAYKIDSVLDTRRIERELNRAPVHLVGARERSTGRELCDHDEIAAVELRNEARRSLAKFVEPVGDDAQVGNEHEDGYAHDPSGEPAIAPAKPIESPIE